jgi:LPPG:FO 2-phospho-L-lactate transferase
MITVLAGGVGGARFVSGLAGIVDPLELTIIVNTGDDIELHGLHISPDLDTICYTLAGWADPMRGWGISNDSYSCLDQLERLGESTWFRLGDRDLATHILRSGAMHAGMTLTEFTSHLASQMDIHATILPMTDAYVPTFVDTADGHMHLQEYFVREQCRPAVRGFHYTHVDRCQPAPGVLESIEDADAVIIAPSNPFISIQPILAVPGVRAALSGVRSRVAAISPIIQGSAVKGPAAVMLQQMGCEVSAAGVAGMYREIAALFVIDRLDSNLSTRIQGFGMRTLITETLMTTRSEKEALARAVLDAMNQ